MQKEICEKKSSEVWDNKTMATGDKEQGQQVDYQRL